MTPLTSSTTTRPSATVPAVRPSRASAWERDRSPGSTHDQNSRKPTPPATKTAVSSSRPWGRISPQKSSPRSCRIMIDPMIARLAMLSKSTLTSGRPRIPRPRQSAVDPGVVDPHLRGEVAGGVLAVVALEVVVDQLVDLARRQQALLDVGVVEQPPHHHGGDHDVGRQAAEPPVPQPVERGREAVGEEQQHAAPAADPGADRAVARPGEQGGEVRDERRVGRGRAQHRQVGGDLLVALDELVGLVAAQPALAQQRLEAGPVRVVCEHIRVQVHAAKPRLIRRWPHPEFATLTTDDLVTGEAVALDLPPASLGVAARVGTGRRAVDRRSAARA